MSRSRAREGSGRIDTSPGSLEAKTRKHFLWSLRTKQNTIYFLGSVHMLTSDSYPLAEEIERAYDRCQKIVFETDLDGLSDPGQQAKLVMLGFYPLGQTLQQNLSEETYKALQKKVDEAGLSMAQFDPFKPWMCALTLAVVELQRLGFNPQLGIDKHFFEKAKRDGKERIFLEPVEYQLNLFAKMEEREQESFLRQTLKELEVLETMASDMVQSWKTGDVDKLSAIFGKSFKGHQDIYNRLMINRNRTWASQIEKLIGQRGDVLIIVGAGHMVGRENILELLNRKGHEITQSNERPETAKIFDLNGPSPKSRLPQKSVSLLPFAAGFLATQFKRQQ